MTDEGLVERAQTGDSEAFGVLIDRHRSAVVRTALAVVADPAAAEDVAQAACVKAWLQLSSFRRASSFKTWLLTIAWRTAISHRRSWRRWWALISPLDDLRTADAGGLAWAAPGSPVDARLEDRDELRIVQVAIWSLPARLRDALLLAASGLSMQEVASILGVPEGTVKWRISEARRLTRTKVANLRTRR